MQILIELEIVVFSELKGISSLDEEKRMRPLSLIALFTNTFYFCKNTFYCNINRIYLQRPSLEFMFMVIFNNANY